MRNKREHAAHGNTAEGTTGDVPDGVYCLAPYTGEAVGAALEAILLTPQEVQGIEADQAPGEEGAVGVPPPQAIGVEEAVGVPPPHALGDGEAVGVPTTAGAALLRRAG